MFVLPASDIMYMQVAVAVVLGAVIYVLFLKKKQVILKTKDGWWGVGTPVESPEDDSIRPFCLEFKQEEIEVSRWVIDICKTILGSRREFLNVSSSFG